jgi:hypothetical protein
VTPTDPRTDRDLYLAIMAVLDSVWANQLDPIDAYNSIMHSVRVWQRWTAYAEEKE